MGRIAVVVIVLLVVAAIYFGVRGGEDVGGQSGTTFTAAQGDLEITVLEGGSVEAAQSVEIKSEVQGQTKILSIVDEGYQITDQNVADGMILVELDAKALMDELTERELNYQNALASYTEAKEQYGIQVSQNQSDISKAEMDVRFAKLDLEKFLGGSLANDIIADLGLDISNIPEAAGEEEPVEEALVADEGLMSLSMDSIANMGTIGVRGYIERGIDFTELADPGKLGDGEARQQLRTHEDDRVLAEEEMGIAKSRLDGTKQLFQKEFVTQIELENDELALRRREIAKDAAEVSRELYVKYEFPKQAEQLLSSYEEALRGLERARKLAISKLAQAEASLNSAEARFNLQERKRDEVAEQIEKCVIRAPQPGMVVYGGSERSWRDDDRIEEGAQIRERQVIITIPNTNVMSVEVKVHESFVQRVEAGQPARIRVDAFPEKSLTGEVSKIAVLPDSQNRWLNPDLKVYATTVTINGNHDWLKPGMSAEAEIVVEQLQEVTYVPLQAVTPEKDEQVCYVQTALGAQRRVVETGQYNDSFIQITDGIEPGDVVLLRVPDEAREDGGGAPGGDGEGASGAQAV
jgi:RND family efflux transporter MFP subunit